MGTEELPESDECTYGKETMPLPIQKDAVENLSSSECKMDVAKSSGPEPTPPHSTQNESFLEHSSAEKSPAKDTSSAEKSPAKDDSHVQARHVVRKGRPRTYSRGQGSMHSTDKSGAANEHETKTIPKQSGPSDECDAVDDIPRKFVPGRMDTSSAQASSMVQRRETRKSSRPGECMKDKPAQPTGATEQEKSRPCASKWEQLEAAVSGSGKFGGEQEREPPNAKSKVVPLTDEKAGILALMTCGLHKQTMLQHMRDNSLRRIIVAVPVDPVCIEGTDLLDIMLGMVIQCDAVDTSGWGCGAVIGPTSLAGKRGCFQCTGMRPVIVEALTNGFGDDLEYTHGAWNQVDELHVRTTQSRLRQKAMLNRIRIARTAWEKKQRPS